MIQNLHAVPEIQSIQPSIDLQTGEPKQDLDKQYRGPRCGYCHGKMDVTTTRAWNNAEGRMTRHRKCLQCGLTEPFVERRAESLYKVPEAIVDANRNLVVITGEMELTKEQIEILLTQMT